MFHDTKTPRVHAQPRHNKSSEIRGRFVGFAWNVGHQLTFKILTDDTKQIICRSRVRLAKEGINNLKLDVESGAVPERIYVRSKRDEEGDDARLPTIDMNQSPFDLQDDDEEGEIRETIPGEPTPMDEPPLREMPQVDTVNDDDDNHCEPSEGRARERII
ncbi:hypothetical protein SEMRO_2710_G335260.1 [Seminavis robusta]|uniref:Uncharacterized protein n=1 Tax=Seminavis robusta TaxID=568900 RepID=A0A9N8EXL3_9STRA|nr:hypothetical protein SEMRO_2710_G335260.1 [Seminavis robusta]|eukprot:Sro2710_g335260.1 n/a (160) ;mRNA; r:7226-7705